MTYLAVGISFVALALVLWCVRQGHDRNKTVMEAIMRPPLDPPDTSPLRKAIDANAESIDWLTKQHTGFEDLTDRRVTDLTHAVADGIERVERSENRVHAAVARYRKKLEASGLEDPSVEAEVAGLQLVDGGGSSGGGVPAVQEELGAPQPAASSIPGVSAEVLAHFRSNR